MTGLWLRVDPVTLARALETPQHCDEVMKAVALRKSTLLGETSRPLTLPRDEWEAARKVHTALAAAQASPANPYGSTKHGRYDAASAAEVAEGVPGWDDPLPGEVAEGVEPGLCPAKSPTRNGHFMVSCTLPAGHEGDHVANGTGNPAASWPWGAGIDWEAVERAQQGHLPQHKGGHPECTAPGCGQPGHHLHAASIPADGA